MDDRRRAKARARRRRAVLVAAACLVGACVNDPRDAFAAEDVAGFCSSFTTLATAKVKGCGYRDIDDIAAYATFATRCRAHPGLVDPQTAPRCLSALDRARCDDLREPQLPRECLVVLVGRAQGGEPCTPTGGCAAGAYCDVPTVPRGCPAGVCVTYATRGETCADRRCATDLTCDVVAGALVCTTAPPPGTLCGATICPTERVCAVSDDCVEPLGLTETCVRGACADGLVCVNRECTAGLAIGEPCAGDGCLSELCTEGVCRRPPRAGEACSAFAVCQEGRCEGGVCVLAGPTTTSTCP